MAWDQHPRYSPDGKLIAFVSDRSGTENIWFMNAMGGNQRQATHERDVYAMLQPSWTPDQRSLLVRHGAHGTGSSDALWRYELPGATGVALFGRALRIRWDK